MSGLLLGLDLRERPVLCVGAGPVGERRARMLVEAGAAVTVVAPEASAGVRELAGTGALVWHRRPFRAGDLDGVWLVHTATGAVDREVADLATRRRLLCICAGDPGAGSVAVPARARIDLGEEEIRVGVLSGDPGRSSAVRDRLVALLRREPGDLRARRARRARGGVALVGGGPGDAELLTDRARTLLAQADVVLADRLAPRDLARLCPQAEVVDVGKAPGRHALTQDEITALLVARARAGQRVVRLKGGDPYVYGRGGEERLTCERAGVPVQVVPGISSVLAGPAAAGIPLTHRGLAGGFSVVEGHDLARSALNGVLDSGADHTLVVLMGVATLRDSAALLAAGRRGPGCPVAVVERATGPDQRVTVGTLGTIADRAEQVGVRNPAVVVVGDVVTLAHAWSAAAPLAAAV